MTIVGIDSFDRPSVTPQFTISQSLTQPCRRASRLVRHGCLAMTASGHFPVIIVGAGPVGLTLAVVLKQYGVKSLILEQDPVLSGSRRAAVLHGRNRQLLNRHGLARALEQKSVAVDRLQLYRHSRPVVCWPLGRVQEPGLQPLDFPPGTLDALLGEELHRLGQEIQFSHRVVGVTETAHGVSVRTHLPNGDQRTWDGNWLVGCDGAASTVREAAGIGFHSFSQPRGYLVADLALDPPPPSAIWHYFLDSDGLLCLLPLPGERWRLLTPFQPLPETAAPGENTVLALLRQRSGGLLPAARLTTAAAYVIHPGSAQRFRRGRFFLAGDAAHIFSPIGHQGLNAGLQDAANLAWKMALVETGRAAPEILDSYEKERRPATRQIHRLTRWLENGPHLAAPFTVRLGDYWLAALTGRRGPRGHWLTDRLEQLDQSFGEGLLGKSGDRRYVWRNGPRCGVQPGQRAPDQIIIEAATGLPTRLSELAPAGRHLLIRFANGTGHGSTSGWLALRNRLRDTPYPNLLKIIVIAKRTRPRCGELPDSETIFLDPRSTLHLLYTGREPRGPKSISEARDDLFLIRPDGNLAWRGLVGQTDGLLAYLNQFATSPATAPLD